MLINNTSSTLRLVSKQCLYFVLPHTTPVRINGEPYAHKFCAVVYNLLSSDITRCQVPSRVRAWFHDSVGQTIMLTFHTLSNVIVI